MGLLCSAKLGLRLPFTRGASTASKSGTPAFFVVAGAAGARCSSLPLRRWALS